MIRLRRSAFNGWLVLTALNLVDLLLYCRSLVSPGVNEVWIMRSLSFNELIIIKLLMPAFVAGLLESFISQKLVKTLWALAILYALVMIWNALQFIL